MCAKIGNRQRIFAHRGLWSVGGDEPNSLAALANAISLGFSLETDVRDWNGKLVVSHDPAVFNPCLLAEIFLLPRDSQIAFNVKSDGLLSLGIEKHIMPGDFVFDCSVPEAVKYLRAKLVVADRLSEYENELPFNSQFVWIDSFSEKGWLEREKLISTLFEGDKDLIFVSPELHGRPYAEEWAFLKRFWQNYRVKVCTDFPKQFLDYVS